MPKYPDIRGSTHGLAPEPRPGVVTSIDPQVIQRLRSSMIDAFEMGGPEMAEQVSEMVKQLTDDAERKRGERLARPVAGPPIKDGEVVENKPDDTGLVPTSEETKAMGPAAGSEDSLDAKAITEKAEDQDVKAGGKTEPKATSGGKAAGKSNT